MRKLKNTKVFILVFAGMGMAACTVRDVTEDPHCCKPQTAVTGKGAGGGGLVPDSSGVRNAATSSATSSIGGVPAATGGVTTDTGVAPTASGAAPSSGGGAASTIVAPIEAGGVPGAGGSSATTPSAVAGMGYCTLGVSRLGACMLK